MFKKTMESIGLHRPELRAWAMYDWANSAFVCTVAAVILPIYYADVAAVADKMSLYIDSPEQGRKVGQAASRFIREKVNVGVSAAGFVRAIVSTVQP